MLASLRRLFLCVLIALPALTSSALAQSVQFVRVFGSTGSGDGEFRKPHRPAITRDGNLLIPDQDNGRIHIVTINGDYVGEFGTPGSGDGQLNGPLAIEADSAGDLYVVEFRNHRVQKFDSDGNFLLSWGVMGSAPGQFNTPSGITITATDEIVIADQFNHRIQVFDSNGQFQSSVGVRISWTTRARVSGSRSRSIQESRPPSCTHGGMAAFSPVAPAV